MAGLARGRKEGQAGPERLGPKDKGRERLAETDKGSPETAKGRVTIKDRAMWEGRRQELVRVRDHFDRQSAGRD